MISAVFYAGGATFSVATLVFVAGSVFHKSSQVRSIFSSATAVACVTAAINFAQAVGISRYARPGDNADLYWLEWAGYAVSLFFIGSSVAQYLNPAAKLRQSAGSKSFDPVYAGLLLSVVGLGGLGGLLVPSQQRAVQWAFVLLTSAVYAVWIAGAAKSADTKRFSGRIALLVYFTLSTALYVAAYVAGPPVYGAVSATTEHAVYFAGNVLTKLLLPFLEVRYIFSENTGPRKK